MTHSFRVQSVTVGMSREQELGALAGHKYIHSQAESNELMRVC